MSTNTAVVMGKNADVGMFTLLELLEDIEYAEMDKAWTKELLVRVSVDTGAAYAKSIVKRYKDTSCVENTGA